MNILSVGPVKTNGIVWIDLTKNVFNSNLKYIGPVKVKEICLSSNKIYVCLPFKIKHIYYNPFGDDVDEKFENMEILLPLDWVLANARRI